MRNLEGNNNPSNANRHFRETQKRSQDMRQGWDVSDQQDRGTLPYAGPEAFDDDVETGIDNPEPHQPDHGNYGAESRP